MHVSAEALELQVVVSCLIMYSGTNPGSCTSALISKVEDFSNLHCSVLFLNHFLVCGGGI